MNVLSSAPPAMRDLSERSREVFRHIVAAYVESGEPSVAHDFTPAGHGAVAGDHPQCDGRSGGRRPSLCPPYLGRAPADGSGPQALRPRASRARTVDRGRAPIHRRAMRRRRPQPAGCPGPGHRCLAGLSHCAGLVMAPKSDRALRHIEFVHLGPGRALVVIVTDDGLVENRIIDVPMGLPASSLIEASNFLSARLVGRTIAEAKLAIATELSGPARRARPSGPRRWWRPGSPAGPPRAAP